MAKAFHKPRLGVLVPGTKDIENPLEWWNAQTQVRSYNDYVLGRLDKLPQDLCTVGTYGGVSYGEKNYPLKYVTIGDLDGKKPVIFISAGVHGYEEGGVEGVFTFLENEAANYAPYFDFVILPCVSPSAYEKDVRQTGDRENPNRHFVDNSRVPESRFFVELVRSLNLKFLFTFDCHETTFTDPTVIAEAPGGSAAEKLAPDDLPDGTYIIEDCANPDDRMGDHAIKAVEDMGLPICRFPTIFKCANTDGVLFNNLSRPGEHEHGIPGMTGVFLRNAGFTDQSFISETYVTEDMFNKIGQGMHIRSTAQITQIMALLDESKRRLMPR